MRNFRSPTLRFVGASFALAVAVACSPSAPTTTTPVKPVGVRSTVGKVISQTNNPSAAPTPSSPASTAVTASPDVVASVAPSVTPSAKHSAPASTDPSATPSAVASVAATASASPTPPATGAASPTPVPSVTPAVSVKTVSTVAGTVGSASFGDGVGTAADGTAGLALFNQPSGLALDAAGNLYVADTNNHRIRKLTFAANGVATVTTIAGSGAPGSLDNTDATKATFKTPTALTIDPAGNIYVSDTGNQLIREIMASGGTATIAGITLNGNGVTGFIDGSMAVAKFNVPRGIVIDGTNLFVADGENNAIRKIDLSVAAHTVSTFAGSSSGLPGLQDGAGTAALFNVPFGLSMDASHNLYVAENLTSRIRKIDSAGNVTIYAGPPATLPNGTSAVGSDNGPVANAKFNFFNSGGGVTVAPNGDIYVADTSNEKIRIITNGIVATLAGTGLLTDPNNFVGAFADGPANAAKFNTPIATAVTAAGTVYVADRDNNVIRRIK